MDATIYITVNTLEYLKKGGRLTPAAAALGKHQSSLTRTT